MKEGYKKFFLFFVINVVIIALDQWAKYLVRLNFRWGESVVVLESFFSLTYVRNKGAAFGILNSAPAMFREPFFIILPIVALVVIAAFYIRLPQKQTLMAVALSMISAGAIGNLIDRVRFGYVIDFLDFYLKSYHWPAFNIADSCIVVGVGLLFIQSFLPLQTSNPEKAAK